MQAFSIQKNLYVALKRISREHRDALGYLRHTFRIELDNSQMTINSVLSDLIDRGWQMVANPIIVERKGKTPRHVIFSMIHSKQEPLRMQFRARGGFDGEMRSEG